MFRVARDPLVGAPSYRNLDRRVITSKLVTDAVLTTALAALHALRDAVALKRGQRVPFSVPGQPINVRQNYSPAARATGSLTRRIPRWRRGVARRHRPSDGAPNPASARRWRPARSSTP